jgi:hypothetical protein
VSPLQNEIPSFRKSSQEMVVHCPLFSVLLKQSQLLTPVPTSIVFHLPLHRCDTTIHSRLLEAIHHHHLKTISANRTHHQMALQSLIITILLPARNITEHITPGQRLRRIQRAAAAIIHCRAVMKVTIMGRISLGMQRRPRPFAPAGPTQQRVSRISRSRNSFKLA